MRTTRCRINGSAPPANPFRERRTHATLAWFLDQNETLERNIKLALDAYGDSSVVGRWSKTIIGIGPVLSAGLLATSTLNHGAAPLRARS